MAGPSDVTTGIMARGELIVRLNTAFHCHFVDYTSQAPAICGFLPLPARSRTYNTEACPAMAHRRQIHRRAAEKDYKSGHIGINLHQRASFRQPGVDLENQENVQVRAGLTEADIDIFREGKDALIDENAVGSTSSSEDVGKDSEKGDRSDGIPTYNDAFKPTDKYQEDPFGNEEGNKIIYKTLTWWQTGFIMIAETISLGILSLPSVLATVGLLPGIILIIGLGIIATYTGYVLGQYKMRYPHIHTMGDAGEVLCGAIGREICGFAQTTFLIFIMASHVLTFSIMLNVLTEHSMCTVWFMVIGAVISFILTLPRTLKSMSHLSIASFASVIAAIMITMIGVGVVGLPKGTQLEVTTHPSFPKAFIGVMNIIFAYAGHLAFFSFISEMKNPKEYPKALCMLQVSDTVLYLVAAVVIYRFTGKNVASPALGSTGPLLRKIAYGIASPTIIIAGVINAHVAAKYVFLRLFRGTEHLGAGSLYSNSVWVGILVVMWTIAWVIAEAIPSFNNLLALISALFVSWFTYGISGVMWLHINKGQWTLNWKKMCLTVVNFFIIAMGITITGLGLYASGKAIHDQSDDALTSFSCADNSQ